MSRHRGVRNMQAEYEDYAEDEEYDHDHHGAIFLTSSGAFIYNRGNPSSNMSTYFDSLPAPAVGQDTGSGSGSGSGSGPGSRSGLGAASSNSSGRALSSQKNNQTAPAGRSAASATAHRQPHQHYHDYEDDYGDYDDYDDYDSYSGGSSRAIPVNKKPAKAPSNKSQAGSKFKQAQQKNDTTQGPAAKPATAAPATIIASMSASSSSSNPSSSTSSFALPAKPAVKNGADVLRVIDITDEALASSSSSRPFRSGSSEAASMAAVESLRLEKMSSFEKKQTEQTDKSEPAAGLNKLSMFDSPTQGNTPRDKSTVEDASNSLEALKLGSSTSPSASSSATASAASAMSSAKRLKEVQSLLEEENQKAGKSRLNLVVIGHVDAGKSTLMGHLLFLQGRVSQKVMHKYEKESKEQGKQSFHFAWVLDQQEEERNRGITIDVAVNYFETASKRITLLDAPGHRDFIPNMISGAAQADAAILVVPATKGEFEAGFTDDGQIKEHAMLVRSLGVNQIIVAVNKLDMCDWSQERFDQVLGSLMPFLKSTGFKDNQIWPIPVSGLTGENILSAKQPDLLKWYSGPPLIDLIDHFQLPPRFTDKPVRLAITDVFRSMSLGFTICGKLETGCIIPKDKLLLLPVNEVITIKAIEWKNEAISIAKAGDNIELGVKDLVDNSVVSVGQWLCDPAYPIPMVTYFRAQIVTCNYSIPLLSGTSALLYTQSLSEPVVVSKLISMVDKSTGATKENPRALPRNSSAIVDISSKRAICLELFREYRELGRFTLRRGNETVALGVVTKLFKDFKS